MGIETLAIASLAASVAGAGVGAMGASATADANSASAQYKAKVAQNNAIIAERNSAAAIEAGGSQAQINDLKTKNLVGSQKVTQASSGLDVGSGTAVDVRQSAEDIGHLDTLTILNNAMKKSQGFKMQASGFTAESQLDRMSADNAETAGKIGVASSLLGGATSFSDKWIGYKQKGVFA